VLVQVTGAADAPGTSHHNRVLSRERAQAVRDYLVSQGVDGASLRVVGVGERDATGGHHASERSVVLALLTPDPATI
jgi:peptidoglycan-associated lipoprotein